MKIYVISFQTPHGMQSLSFNDASEVIPYVVSKKIQHFTFTTIPVYAEQVAAEVGEPTAED